jgi:membrane protease YdiL (CAAX protease family)
MKSIKNFAKRYPVILFFVLAYAITWSTWIPIPYAFERGLAELTSLNFALLVAGSFGPFLSAVILTALRGESLRALFAQLVRWRVSIKWWLAAFFTPFFLYGVMAIFHILIGGQLNWQEVSLLAFPGGFLNVFLWGGGNEELGWRGFALPKLQEKYSAVLSSILIGIVWTLWHAPPGIIEMGWLEWAKDLPFYTISVTGISFVATWLYNNTEGSVLLAMIFHASVNASQSLYPVEEMFSWDGTYARAAAWILLVIVLLAIPGSGFFRNELNSHIQPKET